MRDENQTAKVFLSRGQKIILALIAVAAVLYGVVAGLLAFGQFVALAITWFYVVFVGVKLLVSALGAGYQFPRLRIPQVSDPDLPTYSVLVPMRDETEEGFRALTDWLVKLAYPTQKLQILFVVDADDQHTVEMVRRQKLPDYMDLVVVPEFDGAPKTKPMACNYAMLEVTGDLVVIWDFEDRPDPEQLLKAVGAMRYHSRRNSAVACVQGMLQFWNPRAGKASAFYWAEYVVHFRWMLTGMARLGLIPPLGGTSNHFRVGALLEVARQYGNLVFPYGTKTVSVPHVWDAYNVTEDADLAARFRRAGYIVKMFDSVTLEAAPDTFRKAKNQKSRWLKGFLQTFLVQCRRPIRSMREMGVLHYLVYNLFIGGTPLSFLINPLVWVTTLLYVVSRIFGWGSVTFVIESLFPPSVYYPAMFIAIVGNAVLLYQMLLTPLRQQEHESFMTLPVAVQQQQYGISKRLFVGLPLWWVFTTVPAYKGARELLSRAKRSYWNKTPHVIDAGEEVLVLGSAVRPASTVEFVDRVTDRQ